MVARTSTCLRRLAGGRRSGIVGFSRFLANPRVTVEALLDGWGAELSQGCAGRHILAIQDTSEFNFTTTKERSRGLGKIGKGWDAVFCCTRCWVLMPKRAAFWAWPRAGYGHAMAG
jgi:hypothetical protein